MSKELESIQQAIAPYRQQIIHHPVYDVINDIADLQKFMQHHVFAVWDFMSLLKALQNSLTCTKVPWFPFGSADTRYLINEIVVGEESDMDENGIRKSHLEIYLDAMRQCKADRRKTDVFLHEVRKGMDLEEAFAVANLAPSIRRFIKFTFKIIKTQKSHLMGAVFTFGREDLIPGMFNSMVNELSQNFPGQMSTYKYYLNRHIEVDGDHHSKLALQMVTKLCDNDPIKWKEAEQAAVQALQQRIALWDGAYEDIMKTKKRANNLVLQLQ